MPPGISVVNGAEGGVLTGTPTQPGTYTVTLTVSDSLIQTVNSDTLMLKVD
ncbi:putative Ig domain-containing protein [Pyxidicoccus sp. MSG2]|uniref:putative Ig domain-containing protein n=1 Tax=Pyxidicoccus sp. MSG2 TaxID=2996790 RepID=UPI003B632310